MEELNKIKDFLDNDKTDEAIHLAESFIRCSTVPSDRAYYLLGNAYRKKGNWQMALNNYLTAIELNPNSPAKEAYAISMKILNFYNKDMFNQ